MTDAELRDYQAAAWATAIYPDRGQGTSIYPYLKLCGEAGEVAEMFGKRIRDGVTDKEAWRLSLLKELGDVLWYCAAIATETDLTLTIVQITYRYQPPAIQLCHEASSGLWQRALGVVERIALEHGSTLAEVAALNLAKLAKRADTGTLQGSGSDREERVLDRPNIPGCSCHACGGISPGGESPGKWFNSCPICHNKRCPHCEDHRFVCTQSNEPGQVGAMSDPVTKGGAR